MSDANRIKKASVGKDGKKIVSKGLFHKLRDLAKTRKGAPEKRKSNKEFRKHLEKFGFTNIKIETNTLVRARLNGQEMNREEVMEKLQCLLAKPEVKQQ